MAKQILGYQSPQDRSSRVQNPAATASVACAGMLLLVIIFFLLAGAEMGACVWPLWLLIAGAAVQFGREGHRRSKTLDGVGRVRSEVGIAAGVGGLALMVLGFAILVAGLNKGMEHANRIKCAYNLKRIHEAIGAFARDHDGALPSSAGDLLGHVDAHAFVCQAGDDRTAPGPTTRQVAGNLSKAEHCSYVYVGAGMTWPVVASVVLAYEESDNHDGDGIHVLFGDGVVKWYSAEEAEQLLKNPNAPKTLPVH